MLLKSLCLAALLLCSALAADAASPAVPSPSPQVPTGAWASLLHNGHPRLLGPAADLKAAAQRDPQAYARVKGIVDESVDAAGYVKAVEGLPNPVIASWIKRAMENVARGATNVHQDTWVWMLNVAYVYDLFHDDITPADRQKMVDFLNAHLTVYTGDEGAFHNSTLSKVNVYLRVAYATWGENPKAQEFRDYALQKLYEGKLLPVLNRFGAGGGYTECGWYTRGSLADLVKGLELARRMEGYDGFARSPQFFYQRLAYEIHELLPGRGEYDSERFAQEGDGADPMIYGGFVEHPRTIRMILGQYYAGSELSRYAFLLRHPGSNSYARLTDLLYGGYTEPKPLALQGFPLSYIATGIGKVYARSDWSDDASWLRFEAGDFWNHHQHLEVGNFEIFRRAPLITESGEYYDYGSNHDVNWLLRTIAHNSLLVYLPGETWPNMRDGGRNPYANDGGQSHKWEWPRGTLEEWDKDRARFERADIVGFQDPGPAMFVAADCTKAYSQEKLQSWVRQIVFLRPHTFVIFDRVVSTKPEYRKTWLLHMRNEPKIDGATTTITAGEATAVVQTLLPARPVLRSVYGYTYGGQTFAPVADRFSKYANLWRVELQPSMAEKEDLFLNVIFTDKVQPAKLLRTSDGVGVQVGDAQIVFGSMVGGTAKVGGKTYRLTADVKTDQYE